MSSREYWFEFFQGDKRLGAGFFLTRCYALTALHCLRGIDADDDILDIRLTDGDKVLGRVHRRSIETDMALIDVPKVNGITAIIPNPGRADDGGTWKNPYRPSNSHVYLSGRVGEFAITYQCVGGADIEAIQLECDQSVGDYAGYSGSPIELNYPGGNQTVIGILLEQYPDQHESYQELQRATNVLFAATLAEAYRRFDCFDTEHLRKALSHSAGNESQGSAIDVQKRTGTKGPPRTLDANTRSARRSIPSPKRIARTKLETLRDWQERRLVNEQDVIPFRWQVLKEFIESKEGE